MTDGESAPGKPGNEETPPGDDVAAGDTGFSPLDRAGIDHQVGAGGIGSFPRSGNVKPLTMDIGGESEQFRSEGYRATMQRLVEQQEQLETEDVSRSGKGVAFGFGALVVAAMAAGIWFAYEEGVKEGRRQVPPHIAAPAGDDKALPAADTAAADVKHQDKAVLDQLQSGVNEAQADAPVRQGVEVPLPRPERLSEEELPTIFEEGDDVAAEDADSRKGALQALQELANWEQNRVERLEQAAAAENGPVDEGDEAPRQTLQSLVDSEDLFDEGEETITLSDEDIIVSNDEADFSQPAALPEDEPAIVLQEEETSVIADEVATGEGAPRPLIRPTPKPVAKPAAKPVAKPVEAPKPVAPKPIEVPKAAAVQAEPINIPSTTGNIWRVQIGAFGTKAKADQEWARLQKKYGSVLSDLSKHIQSVERNGATLYRLKGGYYGNRGAAVTKCEALKAVGGSCLVAKD